jgi:hypothetical protein
MSQSEFREPQSHFGTHLDFLCTGGAGASAFLQVTGRFPVVAAGPHTSCMVMQKGALGHNEAPACMPEPGWPLTWYRAG